MILLFVAALLFLLLTTSVGFYVNKFLVTGTNTSSGLFQDLLTGTATITVYLNILSIFFRTDYLLLIPVGLFAIAITIKTGYRASFIHSSRTNALILFHKSDAIVSCS